MKGGLAQDREQEAYPLLDEIPFESERRYMATLHSHGDERLIFVKGAPERILEMCEAAYVEEVPALARAAGAGPEEPPATAIAPLDPEPVLEESNRFAALGLQVLAVYWPPLQFILRTEPLSLQDWLTIIPIAASVLVAVEIEKAVRRYRQRRPHSPPE